MMRRIAILALLLAACAGGVPRSPDEPVAQAPLSEQRPVGDARTRAKSHSDLAMLYFGNGQLAVALEEGRLAVAADGSYAGGYNVLGLAHMFLGETSRAAENFSQASRLAPNDPEINNNYGWFLCQLGREQEGFQRLMLAARNPLYRTPTRSYFNAGLCALRQKDDDKAKDYFNRALAADGTNAGAYFQLADMAYRKGGFEEARRYIGEAHRLIEPSAESLWLALRIERKLGDKQAEGSLSLQLRRKFAGSPQHQAMMEGRYE